jgi:hypothetical protein
MGSLDVAAVAGTWVGVGITLFALLGIVGPLLVLLQTRSDRYRALQAVDSKDTGYITPGWKLCFEVRLFRKSNVPLLSKPPNTNTTFGVPAQTKFDSSSSTAWVNLATVVEAYVSNIPRGDALVLGGFSSSSLPVHRFWLLAIGLLGRYGDRKDKGRKILESNARRFAFDRGSTSNTDSHDELSNTIFGLTGILSRSMFGIHFKPHQPAQMEKLDLDHDPLLSQEPFCMAHNQSKLRRLNSDPPSLQELFWLSLGCLPFRDGTVIRAIDIGKWVRPYESQRTSQPHVFCRLIEKSEEDAIQLMWARAMGINLEGIWCLERMASPPLNLTKAFRTGKHSAEYNTLDPDAQANEVHKWLKLQGSTQYIPLDHVYTIALAAMSVKLSPHSFLFDSSKNMLPELLHCKTLRGLRQLVVLGEMFEVHLALNQEEGAAWNEILSVWGSTRYKKSRPSSEFADFSRRSAKACYKFEEVFRAREWKVRQRVRTILQLLKITDENLFHTIVPVSLGGTCCVEIDANANYVRVWQELEPQAREQVRSTLAEKMAGPKCHRAGSRGKHTRRQQSPGLTVKSAVSYVDPDRKHLNAVGKRSSDDNNPPDEDIEASDEKDNLPDSTSDRIHQPSEDDKSRDSGGGHSYQVYENDKPSEVRGDHIHQLPEDSKYSGTRSEHISQSDKDDKAWDSRSEHTHQSPGDKNPSDTRNEHISQSSDHTEDEDEDEDSNPDTQQPRAIITEDHHHEVRRIEQVLESGPKPRTVYFNYRAVFKDDPHLQHIQCRVSSLDFFFALMCAMVRREALRNVLDSRPLLHFVRELDDITHVSDSGEYV